MTTTARSSRRPRTWFLVDALRTELAPYPGRLAGSLRDALAVCIAVLLSMTLRIPGLSLSLALLFLMQRERPGLTLRVSLQVLSAAALACAAALFWVQLTDGTETARFLGVIVVTFIAAFGMAGTTESLFFTIFGFYGFIFLSSWDMHRSASVIVTSSLLNLASIGIIVLCANAVEYTFGTRHPADDLRWEMLQRLQLLSRFFRTLSQGRSGQHAAEFRQLHNALLQYGNAGDLLMKGLYDRLRNTHEGLARVPMGTLFRIGLLTRVIQKSSLIGFAFLHGSDIGDSSSLRALANLCDHLRSADRESVPDSLPSHSSLNLQAIYLELRQYSESFESSVSLAQPNAEPLRPAPPYRIFLPNVFREPDTALYALKVTLAATICYVLYNAFAWPGILTCVVTVLFTSLSSTGAIKQKQLYRFSGATLGGFLGIASVSLLYPNMDSITSLMLVVAAVSILSGWVLRSLRIGYVGVQIAFAFFLTALPDFSPATQLVPARDRVVGVALGVVVMWFIFDQLWPTRATTMMRNILHRIQESSTQLVLHHRDSAGSSRDLAHLRTVVSVELMSAQQISSAVYFDIGRHQSRELALSRRLIQQIEAAAGHFYLEALRLSHSTSEPK